MENLRELHRTYISDVMEKTGHSSPSSLARAVGLAASTLSRVFNPDTRHHLSASTLAAIAEYSHLPAPGVGTSSESNASQRNYDDALFFESVYKTAEAFQKRTPLLKSKSININDEDKRTISMKVYDMAAEAKKRNNSMELSLDLPLACIDLYYGLK